MPADFDECRRKGGEIKTKTIDETHYMHICILNGKSYGGEVKTKMSAKDKVRKGLAQHGTT